MFEQLLSVEPKEFKKLEKLGGLIGVSSVVLPYERNVPGKNWFFGWPVAAMSGKTIIVCFQRIPSHSMFFPQDQFSSRAVIVRSPDEGRTWEPPVDLRDFIKEETKDCRLGFGTAICVTPEHEFVLVTPHGVFTSKNGGKTFTHHPEAYGKRQLSGPTGCHGPLLGIHPTRGLISAMHVDIKGDIKKELWLRFSKDWGRTWTEEKFITEKFVKAVEPTALVHDGRLILLARSHGCYDQANKTWNYVQLVFDEEVKTFEARATSITTSETAYWSGNTAQGPWSQDTADICFNPITKRLEAVVTNRTGGGKGNEQKYTHQTLNLWSIDPAELFKGSAEWEFEGTLLSRFGTAAHTKFQVDGMHPGASVLDIKRKLQHVFVYCGYGPGPSGIFKISRSLDTPLLKKKLEELAAEEAKEELDKVRKKLEEGEKASS